MKINELISPKSHLKNATIRRDVTFKLKELGFQKIGEESSFADVFANPKLPYILKIFDSADTAYLVFAKMVAKNQNNPHFPKLRGSPVWVIRDSVMAIRMERLLPIWIRDAGVDDYDIFRDMLDDFWNNTDIRDEYYKDSSMFEKYGDSLRDAVQLIKSVYEDDMMLDLHKGNIMMRGDCPVIIDPFARF